MALQPETVDVVDHHITPSAPPPTPVPAAGGPAPVIDQIIVEKPEVCQGEENLITIRAHTENGTDDLLHYAIDGHRGSAVPISLFLKDNGEVAGKHFISVFGRDNVVTTVPLPAYKVNKCQSAQYALVQASVQANAPDTYDFVATVMSRPPPPRGIRVQGSDRPFVPVSYAWSFGDGETAKTDVPTVTHGYEGRAQDSLYSQMVVSVEVRNRDGDKLTGRTSLPLLNPAFESRSQKGIVSLLVSLEPRFPQLDDRGRVEQHVRLRHTERRPVTIERVTMTKYPEHGVGQSELQDVGVARVLGTTTIPAGKEGITMSAVLDTAIDPHVFSITYSLYGKSADGLPVMGTFSVMRPPPLPNADNSKPITDPGLKAKIIAAREMLHKDVVNDADLAQLERQGKFANLDLTHETLSTPGSLPPR